MALVAYALLLALFLQPPQPTGITAPPEAESEAIVISYPQTRKDRTTFEARVFSVDGQPHKFNTRVNCNKCPAVLRGQRLLLRGEISRVESDDNFGSFNWAKFLAHKEIFTQLEAQSVEIIGTNSYFWVGLSKVRNSILSTFQNNFETDLAAILTGITIGEKGDISRGLYTAFQDSGAMHLLVASGGNVGFVTLIVYFLCSLLGAGRRTSAAAALVLAALYTLIAGADAPLMRAYIMTLFATIGFLMGRKSGILHGLITAALLILILNPQSIFEAGFQMSFLATLGIILLATNFKLKFTKHKVINFILQLFFVSLVAQMALLPVFTNYFYKISFTAPFSNILLVPLSGIIIGVGFSVWLISFIPIEFVFKTGLFALEVLLVVFKMLVEFFADFAISKYTASAWKPTTIIAYYILLFAGLNLPIIKRKFLYCAICGGIILILLFSGIFINRNGEYILQGRYSKVLVIKERGKIRVIGAGVPGDTLRRAVLAAGRKRIDCLFLNSLSKSASYGLENLEGVKVKNVYMPEGEPSPETSRRISGRNAAVLNPGDEACGVRAAKPWYMTQTGRVYKRAVRGNLSFIFKDSRTAANMQNILTAQEFAELSEKKPISSPD